MKLNQTTISLVSIHMFLSLVLLTAASDARAQDGRPALVKTAPARAETAAATAEMTGTLYFDRVSRVAPEESARITAVAFHEGDRVKKGAALVRMDRRILEKELAFQKARLKQVQIRIRNAQRNLERLSHLFKTNAASESVYDDQYSAHQELLQEQIALTRQVDIMTIRMEKFVVRAPFDGLILKKQAEVGEWVSPGVVLCVLAASDSLHVEVPVGEQLVRFSREGDRLPVALNAFDQELTGIMAGIRPVADPRTKNISLKLRLPYTGPVAENMSATVRVNISDPRPMIMVPRDALVQVRGTDMVYTVVKGKAVAMPVQILYARKNRVGVAAQGLAPGTDVVVEGNERLKPGQAVMIQPPDGPPDQPVQGE